jgi:hypothetical protein
MTPTILGLDIGGANLKAAATDGRAASVAFPLWKQPEKLAAALGELVGRFPEADELAVTMTGELCDCFETKRDGVRHIVTAVMNVSRCRPVRVWSTDGAFLDTNEAKEQYLKVAASNWHALATFVGSAYVPSGPAILLDIGSTTTDVIPILDGVPCPTGKTDYDRMPMGELIYTGVRRTPVCAFMGFGGAAELFATTLDAYLLTGAVAEDPTDSDTADGRPATRKHAHARMSRMVGGDPELISEEVTRTLAEGIADQQRMHIRSSADKIRRILNAKLRRMFNDPAACIISGSGEFLARRVCDLDPSSLTPVVSLTERLGPERSTAATAYAVAVLAKERPLT